MAEHLEFAIIRLSEWADAYVDDPEMLNDGAKYVWKIIKATKESYITPNEGREWLLEVLEHNNEAHKKISDSPYIEGVLKGRAKGKIEGTGVDETELGTETDDGVVSEPYLLVVYMPKEVKNEANYGVGKDQPAIEFGVNVEAKQFTYEEDAFSNQYDSSSEYSSAGGGNEINPNVTVGVWRKNIPGFEYGDDEEIDF